MLDLFTVDDDVHILATVLFRKLRSNHYEPNDVICGTVYLVNESENEIIDFPMDGCSYIRDRVFDKQQ